MFSYSVVKPEGEVVELPFNENLPLSSLVAQFPGASIISKGDKQKKSVWLQEFVKFCNEIRYNDDEIRGQDDEKILETANSLKALKDSFWFGHQDFGTELFVRQCYIDLAIMVLSIFDEKVYFNGVALVGSPGIGKSQFLSYLFWYIHINRKDIENIVVTSADDDETIIVKCNDEVKGIALLDRDMLGDLDVKKTICLYDPANKRNQTRVPVKYPFFIVAACSPSTNEEAFVDQGSGVTVKQLFMPLWSEKELREAGEKSSYYWRPDLFDNLFDCIGGTARYTLKIAQHPVMLKTDLNVGKGTKTMKKEVRRKIEKADEMIRELYRGTLQKINREIEKHKITADGTIVLAKCLSARTEDDGRHLLEHFDVNVIDKHKKYKEYKPKIATKYVEIELFKRVDEVEFEHCLQLMKSSDNSIHRGYMFETYVHLMFKSTITLPIYKHTCKKVANKCGNKTFKCSSMVEFSGYSLLGKDGKLKSELVHAPNGAYCLPRYKNFKSIDSMIWPDKMLQITVSDRHNMDLDFLMGLKTILETYKNVPKLSLYFVTPIDVYQKFNVKDELFKIFDEIYTVGISLDNDEVKRAMLQGRPRKDCKISDEDDTIQLDDPKPKAPVSATVLVKETRSTSAAVNRNASFSATVNQDVSTSVSVKQSVSTSASVGQGMTLSVSPPGPDVTLQLGLSERKDGVKNAKAKKSMIVEKYNAKKSKIDADSDNAEEMDAEEGIDSAKQAAVAAAKENTMFATACDAGDHEHVKGSKKLPTPKKFSTKIGKGRGRKNKGDADDEEKTETEQQQVKDKADGRKLRKQKNSITRALAFDS